MAVAERLAQRVAAHGGGALVIDYGREGPPYSDSLMAIRQHEGAHVLSQPGSADLSAWVDFGALRLAAEASGAAVRRSGRVLGGEGGMCLAGEGCARALSKLCRQRAAAGG
jgi:SAM-dependent MidA family methyltransferase